MLTIIGVSLTNLNLKCILHLKGFKKLTSPLKCRLFTLHATVLSGQKITIYSTEISLRYIYRLIPLKVSGLKISTSPTHFQSARCTSRCLRVELRMAICLMRILLPITAYQFYFFYGFFFTLMRLLLQVHSHPRLFMLIANLFGTCGIADQQPKRFRKFFMNSTIIS